MKATEVIDMATWVYKDGKEALVGALEVEAHVIAGWAIEKPSKRAAKPKAAKVAPKAAAKIPTLNNEA